MARGAVTPRGDGSRLEESLELYRSLVRASPDAITATDLEGRITAVSRRTLEMYGTDDEEKLVGRSALEFIVPEEHERALGNLAVTLEKGVVGPVEYTMVRGDGTFFIGSLSAAVVKDATGEPRAFVATTRDVTDQKLAQAALAESEARYRTLVDLSPDPVVILRGAGYRFVNPAFTRLFGYTDADVEAGLRFMELVPEHEESGVRDRYAARLAGEELSLTYRLDLVTKDGRMIPCETSARLIQYEGEPADLVIIRDVTEREQAAERQRRLEARIQQSHKLESLGLLAGGVAHDFNNLLAAIVGNLELIRRDLPAAATARERLMTVETAAMRASDLCNQLLEYAGRRPQATESVDLSALVEETLDLLSAALPSGIRLERRLATDLPPVAGSSAQLRQAVMNLLTNASDAMEGSPGDVTVTTGAADCDATLLAEGTVASYSRPGRHVFVEITDAGRGMAEPTLERMLDPFFTTKNTGRGLGLAAVQSCLTAHHGALVVRSAANEGSTFRLLFPVSAASAAARARATLPAAVDERPAAGVSILVVDDEPMVRNVVEAVLLTEGYDVVTARDGDEALARFRERPDAFAALVVDMTMPDATGADVLRRVRELRPEAPVLLTSGYHEQDMAGLLSQHDFVGFIQKPFRANALLASLARVLDRGR